MRNQLIFKGMIVTKAKAIDIRRLIGLIIVATLISLLFPLSASQNTSPVMSAALSVHVGLPPYTTYEFKVDEEIYVTGTVRNVGDVEITNAEVRLWAIGTTQKFSIANLSLPLLSAGDSVKYKELNGNEYVTWNTGSKPAGKYYFKAELFNTMTSEVIAEAVSLSFFIVQCKIADITIYPKSPFYFPTNTSIFNYTIKNLGNLPIDAHLIFKIQRFNSTINQWERVQASIVTSHANNSQVTIQPGQVISGTANWTIPAGTKLGKYRLYIALTDGQGNVLQNMVALAPYEYGGTTNMDSDKLPRIVVKREIHEAAQPGEQDIIVTLSIKCEGKSPRETGVISVSTPALVRYVDVVMVIDVSGSMGDLIDGETKLDAAKRAAKSFVDFLSENDMIGLVTFSSYYSVYVRYSLSYATGVNKQDIKNIIDGLSSGGWTALWDGTHKGLEELVSKGVKGHIFVVVVLTDGHENDSIYHNVNSCIDYANQHNVRVYTIGFASSPSSVNEDDLKNIAEKTGGRYYFCPLTAEDVLRIYQDIAIKLITVGCENLTLIENVVPENMPSQMEFRIDGGYWQDIPAGYVNDGNILFNSSIVPFLRYISIGEQHTISYKLHALVSPEWNPEVIGKTANVTLVNSGYYNYTQLPTGRFMEGSLGSSVVRPSLETTDFLIVTWYGRLASVFTETELNYLLGNLSLFASDPYNNARIYYLDGDFSKENALNWFGLTDQQKQHYLSLDLAERSEYLRKNVQLYRITEFIKWTVNDLAIDWNLRYIMIFGDDRIVPFYRVIINCQSWHGSQFSPSDVHNYRLVIPSDLPYADLSDDYRPDVAIGRIIGDAETMIYMLNAKPANSHKALIAYYTHGSPAANTAYNALRDCGYRVTKLVEGINITQIDNLINATADYSVILYRGHGAPWRWDDPAYFDYSEIPNNMNGKPIIVSFTCLSGDSINEGKNVTLPADLDFDDIEEMIALYHAFGNSWMMPNATFVDADTLNIANVPNVWQVDAFPSGGVIDEGHRFSMYGRAYIVDEVGDNGNWAVINEAPDTGFALTWFTSRSASCFIGANKISYRQSNNYISSRIFDGSLRGRPIGLCNGEDIGTALLHAKQLYWDNYFDNFELEIWQMGGGGMSGDVEAVELCAYNLYGNPKLQLPMSGSIVSGKEYASYDSTLSSDNDIFIETSGNTTISVDIPPYTIESLDGTERFVIPGAVDSKENGEPIVPIIKKTIVLSSDIRLEGVYLTHVDKHSIPGTHILEICNESIDSLFLAKALIESNNSASLYDYVLTKDPISGNTTIVLRIYPIQYDSITMQASYYDNFEFTVKTKLISPVEIDIAKTANTYEVPSGEQISVSVVIRNLGYVNAKNITVLENLPSGFNISFISENGSVTDSSIVWHLNSLQPDEWHAFSYIATTFETSKNEMFSLETEVTFTDGAGSQYAPSSELINIVVSPGQAPIISNVVHSPLEPTSDDKVEVRADVTDDISGVNLVNLYYSTNNGSTWIKVSMEALYGNETYSAIIPAQPGGTEVMYYINATDKAGNIAIDDNNGQYYSFKVKSRELFPLWIALAVIIIIAIVVVASFFLKRRRKV